jgi:RNA polymerase primary sigma factor
MHSTAAPTDTLSRYLEEIARRPLLSAREESRLARVGDEVARRRLVESNLRLVVVIARRHRRLGLDLLDLIQEGNVGLMAAAERYDGRHDARFATYASPWIHSAIRRALSTRSRLVRLPRRMAEAAARVRRAEAELEQRLGRRPALEEVALQAGVDEETVVQLRRAQLAPISLSEPIEEEIEGDPALSAADREEAARALPPLRGRQRRLLELRYGLDGSGRRTLSQVAAELGVSRERARQLETRTLLELGARAA